MDNEATGVFASLEGYLTAFAPEMAERVETGIQPLFNPVSEGLSRAVMSCAGEAITPYPPQAGVVEAGIRRLQKNNSLWVVGECGVGKTPIGAWIIKAWEIKIGRRTRNIVTAPNHLVYKWKAHFEKIIPDCRCMIVKSYKDLAALRRTSSVNFEKIVAHDNGGTSVQNGVRWAQPDVTEVYILPRDRGKLGYAWRASVTKKDRLYKFKDYRGKDDRYFITEYRCPVCSSLVKDSDGNNATLEYFVTPRGKLRRKHICTAKCDDTASTRVPDGDGGWMCGAPLWQAYNGSRGICPQELPVPGISPRRMAPCDYLRRIGMVFDIYLADEVHELKGSGSLQGQMYADLSSMSRKVVALTGTLVGGYADNLLHLLWRTCAHSLVSDNQTHDGDGFKRFVELYGVVQERKRYVSEDDFTSRKDLTLGRGKQTSCYTKSLPGISPVLFVNFMLDQAVFIRLAEMHDHLPKFDERVHRVPMDPDADAALYDMQEKFREHREEHKPCRAWGGARAAFLRFPDKPWVEPYTVMDTDDDGGRFPAFSVPSLAKRERAKERRIRRLIQRNMIRGRKTWVFSELTGEGNMPEWDWMAWFKEYLNRYGIRTAIMRTQGAGGPKPENREAWIEKHTPNVDVVLSNPALVQTGLDLFDYPSLIFAFPGDNTYRLRQASRRAWRLGQDEDCEVDFVVYSGSKSKSIQDASLALMADKMAASLAIEGDFSSEGLAAMSGGADMGSQLAAFINGELEGLDSKDSFARYRAKFENLMPNLGVGKRDGIDPGHNTVFHTVDDEPLLEVPPQNKVVVPELIVTPEAPCVEVEPPVVAVSTCPVGEEPVSIRERKAQRLSALLTALGTDSVSHQDGDHVLIVGQWYHLVSKHRRTVRTRNFSDFVANHTDGVIAFVEPVCDAGPSSSDIKVEVCGVQYLVSFMYATDYMNGERTPGIMAHGSV